MKLIKTLLVVGIIVAIIFWGSITFFVGSVVQKVESDERPFLEQVGSSVKGLGEDFNRGLNTKTETITLNTDTIEE